MKDQHIVFLVFANDSGNPERMLKALEPERAELHRLLFPLKQKWEITPYVAGSAEPQEIIKDMATEGCRGNIVIFHYAGHAYGTQLSLEGKEGGQMGLEGDNLVSLLEHEPHLKLVFLNACATKYHVQKLLSIGIPLVIATEHAIKDEHAFVFSTTFYRQLVEGDTLQAAFQKAKMSIAPEDGNTRMFREFIRDPKQPDVFPWGLYYDKQQKEMLNWTINGGIQPSLSPPKNPLDMAPVTLNINHASFWENGENIAYDDLKIKVAFTQLEEEAYIEAIRFKKGINAPDNLEFVVIPHQDGNCSIRIPMDNPEEMIDLSEGSAMFTSGIRNMPNWQIRKYASAPNLVFDSKPSFILMMESSLVHEVWVLKRFSDKHPDEHYIILIKSID